MTTRRAVAVGWGLLCLVLGVVLLSWVAYNLLIERQPGTEGKSPIPALWFGVGLIGVGLHRLRGRSSRAASPDELVLVHLRKAGSDLSRPHEIEHFLYFPSEDGARRTGAQLKSLGFAVTVEFSASDESRWCVQAVHSTVPSAQAILALRASMEELAAAEGGEYDGWVAAVVR